MDNAPIGLAVACPTCGARPGERCILLDPNAGWRQLPHYARNADAQGALTTAELRRRAREGAAEEAYPYVPGWSSKAVSDLKREAFVKGAEWEAQQKPSVEGNRITVNVYPGAASVPRGNRRYRGQQ